MGILIEHYAGKFPVWLAPVQASILPISDKFNDYAYQLREEMNSKGIRIEVDDRAEKIGYKIREAQLKRVPYMLIVGEKEVQDRLVSARSRDDGDLGQMTIDDFEAKLKYENDNKVN